MDINELRGLATVVVMTTFLGICWWVFIHKKKEDYRDAEQLPFADEKDKDKSEGDAGSGDEGEDK